MLLRLIKAKLQHNLLNILEMIDLELPLVEFGFSNSNQVKIEMMAYKILIKQDII